MLNSNTASNHPFLAGIHGRQKHANLALHGLDSHFTFHISSTHTRQTVITLAAIDLKLNILAGLVLHAKRAPKMIVILVKGHIRQTFHTLFGPLF